VISEDDPSSYLRLAQFLDLQSKWRGCHDLAEMSRQIIRTAAAVLDAAGVGIRIARKGEAASIRTQAGRWPDPDPHPAMNDELAAAARASGTPRLRAEGEETRGAFPFVLSGERTGVVLVRIPRPALSLGEISFLRFVATLCSTVLDAPGVAPTPVYEPHAALDSRGIERAARRYVAMAVHDLRNPLNVVSGYAALLEEESLGALSPEQREAVDAIGRQTKTLLSVVDLLIDLDRMTAAGSRLEPSRFEVGALFEDLRRTCFPQANGQVQWPGSEAGFEFTSDRRRLFSIVQNLIDNALKHGGDGSVIVACTRIGDQLVLDVRDHGPGLDAELRAALVIQAQTGSETAPRSGLGLYTVASHVHALGGAIEVGTRAPGGTTIRVRVPSCDAQKERAAGDESRPVGAARLVVARVVKR